MIFRPYYYDDLGCAAYLFGCGTMGKGTVVDARADDVNACIAFAATKSLSVTHVIDTHVHADHRSGGPELAHRTGAQYGVHGAADATFVSTAPHDGDEIELSPVGPRRTKVANRDWDVGPGRRHQCGHPLSGIVGFATGAVLLGIGTAMVYPTLLAAIGDVAAPAWRASSVGVYRLWRDLGYALGALLAGVTADVVGIAGAMWVIATITGASGLVAAVRLRETLQPAAV